jgi:DNA-binding NtrC family response regulator
MDPRSCTPPNRILVADDQSAVREALRLLFTTEGYQVGMADSPAKVLEAIANEEYSLLFVDLNYTRDTTSGLEGLNLLAEIRDLDSAPPIVVMTAWATVELAVEAMRRGARDFIQKPWDNGRVLTIARTQLELAAATRQNQRLESENYFLRRETQGLDAATVNGESLIAASPAMQSVLEVINRVGPSDANVLITGENGTGKGLVARALHASSRRSNRPLITVNIGGLSESLFESELFGHVKGAFTDAKSDRTGRLELADRGTLFLDEIGNLSLVQQAKLLRAVETGEFERVGSSRTRRADVRLLSATNADMNSDVVSGRFRRDLFFRLNTVELPLPPLRERVEDILLLARHFLAKHTIRYRKHLDGFDQEAERALLMHSWPGNVRELDHALERAVLMATGDVIQAIDVGLKSPAGESAIRIEDLSLEEVERYLIKKALARCGGNARDAAEALGMSRATFYRRLQEYGL